MPVIDLDEVASQTGFANLLGISQQAVSSQKQKGTLSENGTYGQWLQEYYQHLCDQAAGRGGENQVDVARATVEEKTVKTALGRIAYHEKLGTIIDREEAQALLADWAGFANKQFLQAFERLILDIQGQFDMTVPPELRQKHAGSAIERVRGYALKLGGDSGSGSGNASAAKDASDQGFSGD